MEMELRLVSLSPTWIPPVFPAHISSIRAYLRQQCGHYCFKSNISPASLEVAIMTRQNAAITKPRDISGKFNNMLRIVFLSRLNQLPIHEAL